MLTKTKILELNQIDYVPDGLIELESCKMINDIFDQPTLIHLEGKNPSPLFVSVLLHANEDTGFFAVQQLLKKYQDKALPRSLSIFFGNVSAAPEGLRRLDGQPDYNRVWPGTEHPECDETKLMQDVVNEMEERKPFASIDIHNNTGKNPHYGCINALDPDFLSLAALFSRTVVYFETPKGVQSMAMAELCPSVTVECGQPHLPHGVEHAADFVDTVLHLETFESSHISLNDIDVYQTVARVTVPDKYSFSFTNPKADIRFDKKLDNLNFTKLTEPTVFGKTQNSNDANLHVWDENENEVTDEYFEKQGEDIVLIKQVMPAMLTLVEKVIRQDCLCYLMKRL